ncbi:MAG: NAD-dependent epimerase/dehydratase family protein [Lysobacter sp.]
MSEAPITIGVTGASGYIGSVLVEQLIAMDCLVVSLGRRPHPSCSEYRRADLCEPVPMNLLDGIDAVVHLAANTGATDISMDQEVEFATTLATHAQARGVLLLFVSSQVASANAPSAYGRTKAAIEAAVRPLGAAVIRPGLVYGNEENGLFGLLVSLLRRFRVRPTLLPSPLVQPVHVNDLAKGMILAISNRDYMGQVFNLAGRSLAFNEFLSMIAHHRIRRCVVPLPIPTRFARMVLTVGKPILGPRFDPERLDSLIGLASMATTSDMERLGVTARDPRDGLSRSGRPARRLLLEGRALARSLVFGKAVPSGLLRRYVRALSFHGRTTALPIHRVLLRFPVLLAALDIPSSRVQSNLGTVVGRLGVMCRMSECEPALTNAFMHSSPANGRVRAAWDVCMAVILEVQVRVVFPIARYLARGAR